MISSMTGHDLTLTFKFNSGRTLYAFSSGTADSRDYASDFLSL